MFSDYSDAQLAAAGLDMASVAPNNDNDGVKEWRDLHEECAEVPINLYGPGSQSSTHDFFGEALRCLKAKVLSRWSWRAPGRRFSHFWPLKSPFCQLLA